MLSKKDIAALKKHLDRLYRTFDRAFLSTDPLQFVHRYGKREDREIVGLIASSLAYGRVEGIKRSVEKVLSVMGPSPFRFTTRFSPGRAGGGEGGEGGRGGIGGGGPFRGFIHRFNTGEDIACLIWYARVMIEEEGSIGRYFLKGYSETQRNVKEALSSFSRRALSIDPSPAYGTKRLPKKAGVRFFFPDPFDGSPCKRLNLYLRWMVRRGDGLDFGQWKEVSPSKLVIPLDTHIERISRNIGLTSRASADWKTAEEITESLKALDPADPVKYDFALCRLGILEKCPKRKKPGLCEECIIKNVCVL